MSVHKRVIKDIKDGQINLKEEFGIHIAPEENNFYQVHFILPGPEDTPYEGGLYHGLIRLNSEHPLKPPNIHMITPNGRFAVDPYPIPNGNRGICTNFTSFHPENWTPMCNIETVLKGFISFMCDPSDGGVKSIKSTPEQIRKFARESICHLTAEFIIKELFPELYQDLINGTYQKIKLRDLSCAKIDSSQKKLVDSPVKPSAELDGLTCAFGDKVKPKKKKQIESEPDLSPVKSKKKKQIESFDSIESSDSSSDEPDDSPVKPSAELNGLTCAFGDKVKSRKKPIKKLQHTSKKRTNKKSKAESWSESSSESEEEPIKILKPRSKKVHKRRLD